MLSQQISNIQDPQQKAAIEAPVKSFINGLKDDRKSLFMGDIFRSLFIVVIGAGLIWFYIRKKFNALVL
ncbi:hypothetical protein ABTM00_20175, partial [Acinetobacter baumannii]